jgi:hypothetical protein
MLFSKRWKVLLGELRQVLNLPVDDDIQLFFLERGVQCLTCDSRGLNVGQISMPPFSPSGAV